MKYEISNLRPKRIALILTRILNFLLSSQVRVCGTIIIEWYNACDESKESRVSGVDYLHLGSLDLWVNTSYGLSLLCTPSSAELVNTIILSMVFMGIIKPKGVTSWSRGITINKSLYMNA